MPSPTDTFSRRFAEVRDRVAEIGRPIVDITDAFELEYAPPRMRATALDVGGDGVVLPGANTLIARVLDAEATLVFHTSGDPHADAVDDFVPGPGAGRRPRPPRKRQWNGSFWQAKFRPVPLCQKWEVQTFQRKSLRCQRKQEIGRTYMCSKVRKSGRKQRMG